MKKIIALVLSVVLAFSVAPSSVFAAEANTSATRTNNEVLQLACTIWPEHADTIMGNTPATFTSKKTASNEVVVQKYHVISENETLEYVEFENGTYAVGNAYWQQTSSTPGTNYTEYEGRYTVVNTTGSFCLYGFKYRIYPNGYDRIIETGDYFDDYTSYLALGTVYEETASGPAFHRFNVYLYDRGFALQAMCTVQINVANNTLIIPPATWS